MYIKYSNSFDPISMHFFCENLWRLETGKSVSTQIYHIYRLHSLSQVGYTKDIKNKFPKK